MPENKDAIKNDVIPPKQNTEKYFPGHEKQHKWKNRQVLIKSSPTAKQF